MSEIISGAIATSAVATCATIAGIAVGVGYLCYSALTWLSKQAQQEVELLDKYLATPLPTHVTTEEARRKFEKEFALIKAQLAKSPTLKKHGYAVARILALRRSPLSLFVTNAEWKKLSTPTRSEHVLDRILAQASRRFTRANTICINRSIIEVARGMGFTRERLNRYNNGKQFLVMEDKQGRALVTRIIESERGARIDFDLTGFVDGSCHTVMDQFLKGLEEKNIRLDGLQRHSHYLSAGVLISEPKNIAKKAKSVKRVYPDQERQIAEAQRRQHYYYTRQLRIKN